MQRQMGMWISKARGCLYGQLAGDALGSLVEFQTAEQIRQQYPDGVREMLRGGNHDTMPGQPTDDSEMALLLARMLVEKDSYDRKLALVRYRYWLSTEPFACGRTIYAALKEGVLNPESQANGALMRVSPLGIWGVKYTLTQLAGWARQDAALTHCHVICQQVNMLYVMAISVAISGVFISGEELYQVIRQWAQDLKVEKELYEVIERAGFARPDDYMTHQGWVLIAFQNALYQLVRARSLVDGIVDTIMQGGDTDTNAAICGALLGAVYGEGDVPEQWLYAMGNCRLDGNDPDVRHPRPRCFWPIDAEHLADALIAGFNGKRAQCSLLDSAMGVLKRPDSRLV